LLSLISSCPHEVDDAVMLHHPAGRAHKTLQNEELGEGQFQALAASHRLALFRVNEQIGKSASAPDFLPAACACERVCAPAALQNRKGLVR
jgi:hypothetical protein